LGFSLDYKHIKRSGLDYWPLLDLYVYEDFNGFLAQNHEAALYMATTKARLLYTQVRYEKNAFIVFGKESAGIPEELLLKYQETCIRIPMKNNARSLNLSNAAAIVLYEALRQHNFDGLALEGNLHHNKWRDNNDLIND
jgi:tRNA (cytidine/uridine-2'-O-)-methyltransferase